MSDSLEPRIVSVPEWPRPRGYSDGMVGSGRVLVTAGQIGWDPRTQQFASDDLVEQVRQTLENVLSVVRAAGGDVGHVVRMTWYLTDRESYVARQREIGAVYREVFGAHYPAMAVVIVAALVEARARVEIEATALIP